MVRDDPPTRLTHLRSRKTDTLLVPTLTMVEGPEMGAFFPFDRSRRAHRLGRGEEADIRLNDPSVSRLHAVCVVASRGEHLGVRIEDSGSTNGVLVNGRVVKQCSIISGDKVRLGDILLRFEWMAEEEIRYHTDVSVQVRKAERDHLTGLLTRAFLDDRLLRLIEEVDRRNQPISCFIIDLDHFKSINDVYGHLAGDTVLQRTAEVLMKSLRETDYAIRYGGEEFLLLMQGLGIADAAAVANRFRVTISSIVVSDLGAGLRVSASIGVATRARGEAVDQWIARADKALYGAKESGRDRVGLSPTPPAEASVETDRIAPPIEQAEPIGSATETALPAVASVESEASNEGAE